MDWRGPWLLSATLSAVCLGPACGRLMFERAEPGSSMDGSVNGADGALDGSQTDAALDGDRDAAPGLPTCLDWESPFTFGAIEPITEVNTGADERGVRVSEDGLTITFQSDRVGGVGAVSIYTATRTRVDEPFGEVTLLDGVNSTGTDSSAFMRADGLEVIVSSDRPGGLGQADLWQLTRSSQGLPFGNAMPLENVNTTLNEWDPFLHGTLELFYSGRTGTSAGSELFTASRPSELDPFSAPVQLVPLGSDSGEGNPSLTRDGRIITFNSARPGGSGGSDVWYATRADVDSPWSTPAPVPGVNTASGEGDPFLHAGGCVLYFITGTPGDIYRARYQPL